MGKLWKSKKKPYTALCRQVTYGAHGANDGAVVSTTSFYHEGYKFDPTRLCALTIDFHDVDGFVKSSHGVFRAVRTHFAMPSVSAKNRKKKKETAFIIHFYLFSIHLSYLDSFCCHAARLCRASDDMWLTKTSYRPMAMMVVSLPSIERAYSGK